ncbi:MAG: hypothetical protein JNL82_14455 [Myxococcales bacterium]|nr:hypothetical protein [Myxococcales bacterium]
MYRITALPKKRVLDPATGRPIPEAGLLVEKLSPYWLRRKRENPPSITVTEERPTAPLGG